MFVFYSLYEIKAYDYFCHTPVKFEVDGLDPDWGRYYYHKKNKNHKPHHHTGSFMNFSLNFSQSWKLSSLGLPNVWKAIEKHRRHHTGSFMIFSVKFHSILT